MHSLACNHALVDGNKRLALLATVVFLRINGYVLDLTDDEAFDLTMSVAAGQLDAEGIGSGFDSRKHPRDHKSRHSRFREAARFCRRERGGTQWDGGWLCLRVGVHSGLMEIRHRESSPSVDPEPT